MAETVAIGFTNFVEKTRYWLLLTVKMAIKMAAVVAIDCFYRVATGHPLKNQSPHLSLHP